MSLSAAAGSGQRRHWIRGISKGRQTTGSLDKERQKDWRRRGTRSQSPHPFLHLVRIAPGDYCEGACTYRRRANCRIQTHILVVASTSSTHSYTHTGATIWKRAYCTLSKSGIRTGEALRINPRTVISSANRREKQADKSLLSGPACVKRPGRNLHSDGSGKATKNQKNLFFSFFCRFGFPGAYRRKTRAPEQGRVFFSCTWTGCRN